MTIEQSDFEDRIAAANILVVDDEAFHSRVVDRFLRSLGYKNVVILNDSRGVQEATFRQDFDLVLLDIDMPHLDGFDVMRILNARRRSDDYLPILVFTGHLERDVRLRALEAGAKDFLTKPLEPEEAKHRIRNLLEVRILHNLNRLERDRYQTLLGSILPRTIVARLRAGESQIADRLEDTSVLFSDLVGFTTFSATRQPREILDALSGIFKAFDQLAKHYELEKIKTIGDAYMVVGGLARNDTDHPVRMADMALGMVDALANNEEAARSGFRIRIGLHAGPLVAGLIGGAKSTYDVWGDTVNTASRFESNSQAGRINVSAPFAGRLGDQFELEPRGMIPLAGKGEMEAYFLGPRRLRPRHTQEWEGRLGARGSDAETP